MLIWSGGKKRKSKLTEEFEKNVAEFDQFPWFCKNKEMLRFEVLKKKNDKGKKRRARELINSRYIQLFWYDHSNKPHM